MPYLRSRINRFGCRRLRCRDEIQVSDPTDVSEPTKACDVAAAKWQIPVASDGEVTVNTVWERRFAFSGKSLVRDYNQATKTAIDELPTRYSQLRL